VRFGVAFRVVLPPNGGKRKMTTIKVKKESKYVTIHNEFFEIPTLSFGAKGLLGYIISKPENWKIRKTDLIKKSTGGKDQIDGYLLELMAHGFMNWFSIKNEEGKIEEWEYEVYEMPYMNPNKDGCIEEGHRRIAEKKAKTKAKNAKKKPKTDNPIVEQKPQSDYPTVDNPTVDNPTVDNPPYSNKELRKKDYTKKYVTKTDLDSLSIEEIDLLENVLASNDFNEREIKEIILLISKMAINNFNADDIFYQLEIMKDKDIEYRPAYFVKGLGMNIGKATIKKQKQRELQEQLEKEEENQFNVSGLPFYNWLEQ
jgi:hypothetical protein